MLIVPDVHQKMERLAQILTHRKENEPVIYLGDFFDDFHDTPQAARRMAQELITHLTDNWRACLGNHDLHYLFPEPIDRCTGYTAEKRSAVRFVIEPHQDALWDKFAVFYRVGPWLLSHAGLTSGFHTSTELAPMIATTSGVWSAAAMTCARAGLTHELFHIGMARGGFRALGGPLWCDFDYEFADNHALPPQIVGHTPHDIPTRIGRSWDLDTHLNHFARIWEPPAPNTTGPVDYALSIYERNGTEIGCYAPPTPLSESQK